MLNILAIFRSSREKIYDYYCNGIGEHVKRDREIKENHVTKISNFFSDPSLISESKKIKIYLGNSYNAGNFSTLNKINTECIINVSNEIPNYFPNDYEYCNIAIPDKNNYLIQKHFEEVLNFFFSELNKGKQNFFIHCYYGSSRSAIIVLLLLVRYFEIPYDDAKIILERKRNFVNINVDFLNNLKDYLDLEKN